MFQGGRKQGCLLGWSRHLGCVCGQSLGEMFDIASAPFVTSQADYFQKCVLAEAFWRVEWGKEIKHGELIEGRCEHLGLGR